MSADVDDICAEIARRIEDGELRNGDRLPTERQLAISHQTSRAVVRKAFDFLERNGQISRNVGKGTFVGSNVQQMVGFNAGGISPAQFAVARQILEPAVAANAAVHATADDFAAIERCFEKCEKARDLADFDYWDGELHTAIAKAAHNSIIEFVYQTFSQVRRSSEWQKIKVFAFDHHERRIASQQDHRRIVDAVISRDASAAREAMHLHLERISRFIATAP